jgi:hypothetical protein
VQSSSGSDNMIYVIHGDINITFINFLEPLLILLAYLTLF